MTATKKRRPSGRRLLARNFDNDPSACTRLPGLANPELGDIYEYRRNPFSSAFLHDKELHRCRSCGRTSFSKVLSAPVPPACPGAALTRSENVRAQACRSRRRPLHSRDPPRQACSFKLSFSCGEHAPARRARTLYSFLRILHVSDSSAVFRAWWWWCYKYAAWCLCNGHADENRSCSLLAHTLTRPCNCGFSSTGVSLTVC